MRYFLFQVFNLAAPTPVTNGVGGANGIETEESEKVEKLVDKEENNNKKNKRPLEEVEKVEDTRKKAATDGGPKPTFEIPSFGGNSDFSSFGNGSSPKGGNMTPCGSSKPDAIVSPIFTFCSPTTVITQVMLSLLSIALCLNFQLKLDLCSSGIPGSSKCRVPLFPPHNLGEPPGGFYDQLSSIKDSPHSEHSG